MRDYGMINGICCGSASIGYSGVILNIRSISSTHIITNSLQDIAAEALNGIFFSEKISGVLTTYETVE